MIHSVQILNQIQNVSDPRTAIYSAYFQPDRDLSSESLPSSKPFILANKRRRSSVASLGNRHDGKKGKKQKHVNKKNDIFPHGNYRQYYGIVEIRIYSERISFSNARPKRSSKVKKRVEALNIKFEIVQQLKDTAIKTNFLIIDWR